MVRLPFPCFHGLGQSGLPKPDDLCESRRHDSRSRLVFGHRLVSWRRWYMMRESHERAGAASEVQPFPPGERVGPDAVSCPFLVEVVPPRARNFSKFAGAFARPQRQRGLAAPGGHLRALVPPLAEPISPATRRRRRPAARNSRRPEPETQDVRPQRPAWRLSHLAALHSHQPGAALLARPAQPPSRPFLPAVGSGGAVGR